MLADQILDRKGRNVATIRPDATIADALEALAEHNVGALVVSTDGSSVDGIVSERDIVRRLASSGAAAIDEPIQLIMVAEVATCTGHTHAEEIMNIMTSGRFRHVPIVDDDQLVGIVSIGDVVKSRIDELADEKEQLVDYIRTGR